MMTVAELEATTRRAELAAETASKERLARAVIAEAQMRLGIDPGDELEAEAMSRMDVRQLALCGLGGVRPSRWLRDRPQGAV